MLALRRAVAGGGRTLGTVLVPRARAPLLLLGSRPLSLSADELRREMDNLNDLFVEARDEIEYAEEAKETTYFNEEAEAAQEAVDGAFYLHGLRLIPLFHSRIPGAAAMDAYNQLLDKLDDEAKQQLQRSNGLKMEQLKGELAMMLDDHE